MDVNAALELFWSLGDERDSGEESFLTDDELTYQDGLDPAEE